MLKRWAQSLNCYYGVEILPKFNFLLQAGLEKAGDLGRKSPLNIHVHTLAVFMARE